MKKYLAFLSLALPTLLANGSSTPVTVPAGSVNELAAAIAAAGGGGTVVVASGPHTETGTVLVSNPVSIIGQPGAIIETESAPSPAYPLAITPLLHIQNTSGVTVQGVWFRPPSGGAANTAVLVENAPHAEIAENRITDFQFGVIIQRADHSVVRNNEIRTTRRWALDPADPQFVVETDGIMLNSGHFVQIVGNQVSDSLHKASLVLMRIIGCPRTGFPIVSLASCSVTTLWNRLSTS
jgi:nitrous oxidase accessory protein NosD